MAKQTTGHAGGPTVNMHVSMWTDSYYPYISGVTRAVATMRDTLSAMGHEVSIFCPDYPEAEAEDKVYRFPSIKSPTNPDFYVALPLSLRAYTGFSSLSPDVVHIHSPFNLGKYGFNLARWRNIPVAFTYHTMYRMYSHYIPVVGDKVSKLVEDAAFRVARSVDAVITPSPAMARYLQEHNAGAKVYAIPNGIPLEQFRSGDPGFLAKHCGLPKDVPVILTCGRLGAEKNLDVLLEAFARLRKTTEACLVLVGDGPLKAALVDHAESLGVGRHVFFAGSVNPDLMAHVYAGADLFLFTSLTDTQGLVLVEAKTAGVPAVAVAALGPKDMIEDGVDGYLSPNDPDRIAELAAYLLNHPEVLERMSHAARKNSEAFSKEVCARRLLECYCSLL